MSAYWFEQLSRQLAQKVSRQSRRLSSQQHNVLISHQRVRLLVELLEDRDVPSAVNPIPDSDVIESTASPAKGFTPAQIQGAYGVNQISFNGTAGTGAGTTIAIIDAYGDPSVKSDLHAFDKEFDLPDPVLTVVNQTGGNTLPAPLFGTAGETILDVEWAHAVAPDANILLVEANNQNLANMMAATRYAATVPGVDVVSISYGYPETPGELQYDASVFAPALNPGVAFVVSSGDSGSPVNYPAASPYVLAVGGTSLTLNSSGGYSSESGWTGSTGGISLYESQPAYQAGVVTQSSAGRTNPDVALDANPYTGVDVYQTYGNSVTKPWEVVGGTSDAAPMWAGLIAIADQGRALEGQGPLNNSTLMPMLYGMPTSDFHEITTGYSTGTPYYYATAGYNLVTGLGTPVANLLVPWLVAGPTVTQLGLSAPSTAVSGTPFDLTVTAENAAGQAVPGYSGTIYFSSSDQLAGLPSEYTFTSGNDGSVAFPITLATDGPQSIAATDIDDSSVTGTTSIEISSADSFSITGLPTTTTAGSSLDFTVTALAADGLTTLSSFSGTVKITSSDPQVKPFTVTLANGIGSGAVALDTAGEQSLTATSTQDSTMTGNSPEVKVTPGAATQLAFIQGPSATDLGTAISPAVTVAAVDQYGNTATKVSSGKIALTLKSTTSGAVLTGGSAININDGLATFGNLMVSAVGTGYELVAASVSLGSATSSAFSINPNPVLENFNNGLSAYSKAGGAKSAVKTIAAAAHPGTATLGLSDGGDQNWYYRTDSAGQIDPGQSVSVWMEFPNTANDRGYFGFGSTKNGTYSVVLAPNTGQLLIEDNAGYDSYTTMAATNFTYSSNTWYKVIATWGTNGSVTTDVYASNGATLLGSVTTSTGDLAPGDFAFRASGSTVYFSTVELVQQGVQDAIILPADGSSSVVRGPRSFVVTSSPQNPHSGSPITSLANPKELMRNSTELVALPVLDHLSRSASSLTLGLYPETTDQFILFDQDIGSWQPDKNS